MKKPRRKNSIRKPHWDYRTPGYYFITICTQDRVYHFDDSEIKHLVEETIKRLTGFKSCHHVTLDLWVVMPNHIHLLIYLDETFEFKSIPFRTDKVMPRSVGAIVGTLKKTVSKRVKHIGRTYAFKPYLAGTWTNLSNYFCLAAVFRKIEPSFQGFCVSPNWI